MCWRRWACVGLSSAIRISTGEAEDCVLAVMISAPRYAIAWVDQRDQRIGDLVGRQHMRGGAQGDGYPRHTVDHGAFLVLCDGDCSLVFHRFQFLGAVPAHPG